MDKIKTINYGEKMKKIAILTDSNAGILPEEVEDKDIFVLPMPFIIDTKEYFENITLSQDQFYEMIESGVDVSTSQPSISSVTDMWDKLLEEYETVLHIPMSSGLSSSCDTAKGLSQEYKGRVVVIDNQRISVTLKQSILDAEKMINEGKSVEEIVTYLNETKLDASIYIMVPTLKYLKKGGRITPAAAAIGTLLNIKPVLQIQGGKLEPYVKVMSVKQAIKAMISGAKNDLETRFKGFVESKKMKVYVAYSKDIELGNNLKAQVEKELNVVVEFVDPLSLSVASHIGPNAIAVAMSRSY